VTKKTLDDDIKNRLKAALQEYKDGFVAEHQDAKLKEAAVKPLDEKEKKAATAKA
jgi:F-type H+-transporting ATPase subunit alpha